MIETLWMFTGFLYIVVGIGLLKQTPKRSTSPREETSNYGDHEHNFLGVVFCCFGHKGSLGNPTCCWRRPRLG